MSAYTKTLVSTIDLRRLDRALVFSIATLLSVGIIIVASSSIDFANEQYGDPWFFVKRQIVYLLLGLIGGVFVASVPVNVWQKYSGLLFVFALALLVLVLIPGVGREVNGSRRWLVLGSLSLQASEVAKFCTIIYFADYLTRRHEEVSRRWSGFFKLILMMVVVALPLLLEPDFGSTFVITTCLGAMMFVAGVPLFRFLLLSLSGVACLSAVAVLSPYRWERLITFTDPWARQFDSGYQLVQSLIAFGRGEWFGLGLGNSLQKLFFLPEAHTDFVFAITAEEFGFIGAIALMGLFGVVVSRILVLARSADAQAKPFCSYLLFGFGFMLAIQAFINMGVASGLLPTKGLTLPFVSYGGSSLLVSCAIVALIFRVNSELSDER